jgi:hypothetical protein
MDAGFGSRLFFVGLMASSCSAMDFWAAATAARSLSGTLRVSNLRLPRWVKRRHMIVPPGLDDAFSYSRVPLLLRIYAATLMYMGIGSSELIPTLSGFLQLIG